MMAAAEKAAFSLGRRRRRGEAAWALPHSLYHNKTLFLGPVANGRRVRPRVLAHCVCGASDPAPRAREIAFLHAPQHTATAAKLGQEAAPPRTRDSRTPDL